jgi:Alpha/beta hydrolase of unknown function (DUF900)
MSAANAPRSIPSFIINKFRPINVEDDLSITDDKGSDKSTAPIQAYAASSTAPSNLEDDERQLLQTTINSFPDAFEELPNSGENATSITEFYLSEITTHISKIDSPEIVIAVHGFNTNFKGAIKWYQKIHQYIAKDKEIKNKNIIFIGYRWPSEKLLEHIKESLANTFEALPKLPKILFLGSLGFASFLLVILWLTYNKIILLIFGLPIIIFSLILSLIFLRLFVYFRDTYRASYFGTPDLVELIRQLDKAIYKDGSITKPVKLSFLGHSLGCSVIINAIRILSDTFEPSSIGNLSINNSDKNPSHEIGRVFELDRIVFVAPDIPLESVIPRRSNFLRSAIRRVKEAHVFTNEGDLALRLASTAANYFSFPARTRFSGYRLGNLTVKHFKDKNDSTGTKAQYGIINESIAANGQFSYNTYPYKNLEIRSSNHEHRNLLEVPFAPWIAINADDITNRFNYYDCTDYKDSATDKIGVVSKAVCQPSISLSGYLYLLFSKIDTHGGYFQGKFTQDMIYRLAFIGYAGLCVSLSPNTLDDECKKKQIQVVLSP